MRDPAARAAAGCSPDRQVRVRGKYRTSASSAGATGKELTIEAPCSAPIQSCAEWQQRIAIFSRDHQMGTSIFSQGSSALSRVLGSAPSPPPLRGFPSPSIFPPPGPRGPGYTPRPLSRPDFGIERSDPPIPWIVQFQWAASGGRGLRLNPKRRPAAALQGAGRCRPAPSKARLPEGGEDISQGQGRARQGGPRPLESRSFLEDPRPDGARGERREAGRAAIGSEAKS